MNSNAAISLVASTCFQLKLKNQNVGKIEHHKEKPLIIVDVNGVSSATSAELLTKQGFEKVYVLKDGLAAWAGANLPLVKKHK